MKKSLSIIISLIIGVFTVYAPIVTAQSEEEIRSIFQDSVFYDPNGCTPSTAAAVTGLPSNIDLDAASLAKIQQLLPVYQKYANQYGFPWQILAAKHYRETGLSLRNPSNGQGVWQLYSLVTSGQHFFPEAAEVSVEEFDRQTGIMVGWYFTGEKLTWAKNHSLLELQKLFTLYNGWGDVAKTIAFYNAQKANVTVDRNDSDALLNWNAYSMNQFDSQHQDMIAKIKDDGISVEAAAAAAQRLISTGSSGDPRIGTNKAIGAVPIYTKLGGPIAGLTAGNSSVGGGAATAQTAFTKVYVTGDSLTVGMKTDLTALLGPALVSPIEAAVGRKIEQAIPLVNFPADTDTVLVGLGTNNFSDSPEAFQTKVQDMVTAIRAINPNATIHWINIYAPRSDIVAAIDPLNLILNETAATDTKFKVIDWKTEAINNQYRFTDQLHVSAPDYKRRADFVYRALNGGGVSQPVPQDECSSQTTGGAGAVQGNVVQTALNFSWFEPEKVEQIRAVRNNGPCSMRGNPGECGRLSQQAGALIGEGDAKPAYVAAAREFNKGNDSDGANWAFSDCGVFVATVIRASGADPNYAGRGTGVQRSYMESSGKYDLIPFTDTALAQPGDILIKDGHIRIFLGDNPTSQFNVAEASWGNHVPATLWNATIDASNPNDAAGATYSIGRLKK